MVPAGLDSARDSMAVDRTEFDGAALTKPIKNIVDLAYELVNRINVTRTSKVFNVKIERLGSF